MAANDVTFRSTIYTLRNWQLYVPFVSFSRTKVIFSTITRERACDKSRDICLCTWCQPFVRAHLHPTCWTIQLYRLIATRDHIPLPRASSSLPVKLFTFLLLYLFRLSYLKGIQHYDGYILSWYFINIKISPILLFNPFQYNFLFHFYSSTIWYKFHLKSQTQ